MSRSARRSTGPSPARVPCSFRTDATPRRSWESSAIGLAVIEDGQIVDVVAWNPDTDQVATRFGIGWALGQDQILADGCGSTGLPVPVHRSPLGWLRNRRFGIVILDYRRAALHLADLELEGKDDKHQADLDRLLYAPPPRVLSAMRHRRAPV